MFISTLPMTPFHRRRFLSISLFLLSISTVSVSGHYADPRVASFTIPVKTGLTKQTVQVASGKSKAVCELQYATTEVVETPKVEAAPAKEPEAPSAGNVKSVMDSLKETCVTKRVDYWEYEVCLGGNVRQFHNPDSYSLGTFSRWEGDDQIYDKGQVCSARPDNAPRQVKVTFGCLKGADAPRAALVSIAETQICMYTAVIGTPLACAFAQFPVVTDIPSPVSQPPPPMNFDDGSEDWFLQLSELADGRFICSALSNEARATGSKLAFTKIEMALRVENLPLPAAVPPESAHQYLARRPGRGLLNPKEFQPSYKTESAVRETVIRSSSDFEGKLAFVKVFA